MDDAVLRLLALRQLGLLQALAARGHAATEAIRVAAADGLDWRAGKLPEALNRARAHPLWSSLNPHHLLDQPERQRALAELSEAL